MWTAFIDVISTMFGGTPSAAITSTGLWVYSVVLSIAIALVVYKLGYDQAANGSEPSTLLGLLVKK